ncbi:globin [Novosphingobium percolationis]|uniref:globin n=1 Tax=Novosphingobium percolationis TaxID=2871811 RepID=UPI001CD73ABA|nr:globin [Novosphingobium percolationis]
MSATPSTLLASLDAVAETDIDITPIFFERFFAAHPEHRDSFNRPQATQGAMVNEMIEYLAALEVNDPWALEAIDAMVAKHHSYGDISESVFDDALDILVETLEEVAGERWTAQNSARWRAQASRMKGRIRAE